MRRFEIVLKHLVTAKETLCSQKRWDPVLFGESLDRDWDMVAANIDVLILICRHRRKRLPVPKAYKGFARRPVVAPEVEANP